MKDLMNLVKEYVIFHNVPSELFNKVLDMPNNC